MPAPPIRFAVDARLGKLAARLRMLGLDALHRQDLGEEELLRLSKEEGRVLLTQDRGLLRRAGARGRLVQGPDPLRQLEAILGHFGLHGAAAPFTRCLRCNTLLEEVPKEAVLARLPPKVREGYHEFWRCPTCDRIYWKGTHYARMQEIVKEVMGREGGGGNPEGQPQDG